MNKYLIFLDIDGTLLSRGGIHPRNKAAIEQAIANGHAVFINSGRAKGNFPKQILQELPLTGIVAGLGCYIEMNGNVLHSVAMTDDDIAYAIKIADEWNLGLSLEGEDMVIDYHQERSSHWPSCGRKFESQEELKSCYPNLRVSKMGYMDPLPAALAAAMQERFTLINHPTYAEFGNKHCNKATAMEFLMRHLGIDRDHVIAMGDSYNDTEMLQAAGIAVVMGDGHPDVKPLADLVTIPSFEGGVGYAIEELVLKSQA
ncbi:MAG: HAD family phosphatase [Clostridia bacterium]|nr:HAD family phosphatase [Clostridia bacterium]